MLTLSPPKNTDLAELDSLERNNKSLSDSLLVDSFNIAHFSGLDKNKNCKSIHCGNDFIGFIDYQVKGEGLYINLLYIRHDRRGNGLGTDILNKLKNMGYPLISAHGFTTPAENFFYKNGFKGSAGQLLTFKK